MRDEIIKTLKEKEEEYNIKILYACESGSRGWGFSSTDSDYDVRFIYKHNLDWYLSISKKKDFINMAIVNDLDISGWDLLKALQLVKKSNASIWEWLQSPIIYKDMDSFKNNLWEISKKYYSLKSCCYHYLGLAKNTINKCVDEKQIKYKKYFYILRPLLSAKWMCDKKDIPPMEFHPLLSLIKSQELLKKIKELLKLKKATQEYDSIERIPIIDQFIEDEFDRCDKLVTDLPAIKMDTELLNQFFRKEIKEND